MKGINKPLRRIFDISDLFIEVYCAYPAKMFGIEDINLSNSIILPPSALGKLSTTSDFGSTKDPVFFQIMNVDFNIYTHCSVKEFTAKEGCCYLPNNMFDKLCLEEGKKVNVRKLSLLPGSFVKLQPHQTEFTELPNPKAILEYNLKDYFCLTEGDTISMKFNDKIYEIDVIKCKPNKAIRSLNCNLEIEFAQPKDYPTITLYPKLNDTDENFKENGEKTQESDKEKK